MNVSYKAADPTTSHTLSAYQTKATLDQTDLGGSFVAGDHLIVASAEYGCSAVRDLDDAIVLDVDGVVLGGHNLRVLTPGDILSFFVVKRVTLTAGAHNIRIRTRTTGGGESVSVRNARLLLWWNIQGLQYSEDEAVTTLEGAETGGGATLTTSDKMALIDWEMVLQSGLPLAPSTPLSQASKQHVIWIQSSLLAGASFAAVDLTKTTLSFVAGAGPHLVLASWEQRSSAGIDTSYLVEDTTLLQRHDDSTLYQGYFTGGAALARALQPGGVTYAIRHGNLGGGPTSIRRTRIAVIPCAQNALMVSAVVTADPPPTSILPTPGDLVADAMIGSPAMPSQGYVLSLVQASPSVNAPATDRIGIRHAVDSALVGELVVTQATGVAIHTSMPFASFFLAPLTINAGKSTESEVSLYRVGTTGVARLEYLTLTLLTVYWVSAFSTLARIPERSWPVWLATVGTGD